MHIVSISLDPDILDPQSRVSARNLLYGAAVTSYRVVVHSEKDSVSERPHNVTVYGVGGGTKLVRLLRMLVRIRGFIKSRSCEVISCSDPYFIGFGAWLLSFVYNVGFELNILSVEKQTPFRKLIATFLIRHAGSVRVSSMHLRGYVAKTFSCPIDQIFFVPTPYVPGRLGLHGFLPGDQAMAEQEKMIEEFKVRYGTFFNLLSVGRLVPIADYSMQLRALKELITEGVPAHLHIVGDGSLRDKLKAYAQELGAIDSVTFYGHISEPQLGALYKVSNVFVLTSRLEGSPMSIFDAILARVPIVMTNVGSAGELIHDKEQGLVVPVGDASALTKAVRTLYDDPILRTHLVEAASRSFQNYWSLDKILAGYKQSWGRARRVKD